jgi:hypothetical protein
MKKGDLSKFIEEAVLASGFALSAFSRAPLTERR